MPHLHTATSPPHRRLNLAWNSFCDQGTQSLASALETNTVLQMLDLSYNRVSGKTVMVLAQMLLSNDNLSNLQVRLWRTWNCYEWLTRDLLHCTA